jgi:hypothetical protein
LLRASIYSSGVKVSSIVMSGISGISISIWVGYYLVSSIVSSDIESGSPKVSATFCFISSISFDISDISVSGLSGLPGLSSSSC